MAATVDAILAGKQPVTQMGTHTDARYTVHCQTPQPAKGLRGDWRDAVGLQPLLYGSSLIGMPVCCYDGILHLCLHIQQQVAKGSKSGPAAPSWLTKLAKGDKARQDKPEIFVSYTAITA